MLDSLVRVSRRDRQTTHALDCNTEQCQTTLTDNQYTGHITVTRPYNPCTRLVEEVDRDKLLFAFNNRKNSRKPGLEPRGFAVPRPLNHQLSCMQPGCTREVRRITRRMKRTGQPTTNGQFNPHTPPPIPSLNLLTILASSARLPPRGFTYY